MTFAAAIAFCLKPGYFKPGGRACRREFGCFILFCLLVLGTAGYYALTLSPALPEAIFILPATALLLLSPLICACVRRIHDLNRSGWYLLLMLLPPLLLALGVHNVITSTGALKAAWIALTMLMLMLSCVCVAILCCRGSSGLNRYGADPLRGHDPVTDLNIAAGSLSQRISGPRV